MIKLYGSKQQTFECKVEIEGADYSTVRPRLIFSPENDNKHIYFEGKVAAGVCKVVIPGGLNIAKTGDVVLEVLVDNTMFSPWHSTYEMIVESVKVEGVDVRKKEGTVNIVEAKVETAKPTVKVQVKPKNHYLNENITPKDNKKISEFVQSYSKLKPADKEFLRGQIAKYKPSPKVVAWGKRAFVDTKSFIPRMCMFTMESERKLL